MIVRRQSPITGTTNERDIPITQQQLLDWGNWVLSQDAFPHISADDREFIMTGITPEEWEEYIQPIEVALEAVLEYQRDGGEDEQV